MTIINYRNVQKIVKNTKGSYKVLVLTRKTHALRLPARASLWYITAAMLGRGIGVFGTPVFTRLLSATEYGLYPLYNTWLGIATVFVTLEITGASLTRGLQKYEDKRGEFLSAALGLISTVFIIICALCLLAHKQINLITGLSTPILVLMLVQIYINAIINLYTAGARYSYSYKRVAAINTAAAFLSPIFSVGVITLTRYKSEGRIIGGLIATALIALPLFIVITTGSRRLINLKAWRYLLTMALPLLPHYIASTAILRVGEITVGRVHGTEALGKYSVAISLGLSLSIITGGLISAVGPWLLRHIRQGDFERIRVVLVLLTKGLCLFALLILSVVPETIKILTPPEYHGALLAVYPLVLSSVPTFLSSTLTQGQAFYERTYLSSIPAIISAATSAVLSLLLLPRIDYRFVSLIVLLSYIILFALHSLVFKRLSGKSVIDLKRVGRVYLLTVAYAALLSAMRDYTLVRLVLAIPLLPLLLSVALEALKIIKEPIEPQSTKI